MKLKLYPVLAAGVLVLAGCGGGEAPASEEGAAQEVAQETSVPEDLEPCLTVGEVGSGLSLDWELVVAARGASDQPGYIQDTIYEVTDIFEDLDYDVNCAGGQELRDFGEKLVPLREAVEQGTDTDEQYEEIADLGNQIIELSDDEGYEWDYEFVSSIDD